MKKINARIHMKKIKVQREEKGNAEKRSEGKPTSREILNS